MEMKKEAFAPYNAFTIGELFDFDQQELALINEGEAEAHKGDGCQELFALLGLAFGRKIAADASWQSCLTSISRS